MQSGLFYRFLLIKDDRKFSKLFDKSEKFEIVKNRLSYLATTYKPTIVDLSGNFITDEVLANLISVLPTTITTLNLSNNRLTSNCVEPILGLLEKLPNLKTLYLDHNYLSSEDHNKIASVWTTITVKTGWI